MRELVVTQVVLFYIATAILHPQPAVMFVGLAPLALLAAEAAWHLLSGELQLVAQS